VLDIGDRNAEEIDPSQPAELPLALVAALR
jgi:hypothetical protein